MSEKQDGFNVVDGRHWAQGDEAPEQGAAPAPDAAPSSEDVETRSFQAETRQLLELMIHSLYSNREIFLRELISNASDALDRYRFEALTDDALPERDDLAIALSADSEARTLTVTDNGVGMSRQEVIDNIGTIARSGTRELLGRLTQASGDAKEQLSLIGQFGVGFYASFMVAERVELTTRRAGESGATRWISSGDGSYTLEAAERGEHGTTVTLFLRPAEPDDGLPDFTAEWSISSVVKRYSDFVRYPVRLQVPADAGDAQKAEGDEAGWRQLNTMKAIWSRRPSEVDDQEFAEFYKHITHDWQPPLERVSLQAEGRIEYQALLFLPSRAPFDLFYQHAEGGLELYVRNVKIMERCEQLLPRYLRFVKGVVDSPDLPLNISRELLQHNRQLAQIRRGIVKKVLSTLADLADKRPEDYATFWGEFGRALKEGMISDPENKERLIPLLRVASSSTPEGEQTSLVDYVSRMKPEQDEIYYLTGESRAAVERSPHLEAARERGYEVLYLVDPIDELMVPYIDAVEGKTLRSLVKGDVELGDEQEREAAEEKRRSQQEDLTPLLEILAKKLDEHVKEVRLSKRLTSSAVCLVSEEQDESPRLRRLLRQSRQPVEGEGDKRIMELNPEHALTQALRQRFEANAEDPLLDDYAQLLLGQGLLAEGSELPDPAGFAKLVAELMVRVS